MRLLDTTENDSIKHSLALHPFSQRLMNRLQLAILFSAVIAIAKEELNKQEQKQTPVANYSLPLLLLRLNFQCAQSCLKQLFPSPELHPSVGAQAVILADKTHN
jgi:hypothetical protein